jgi:hypothetical protein
MLGEGKGAFVRTLSSANYDTFQAAQSTDDESKRLGNLRARFVSLCLCDKDGKPLDISADVLGQQEADVIIPLFDAARRLNKILLTKDEREALEKNSGAGQPDA